MPSSIVIVAYPLLPRYYSICPVFVVFYPTSRRAWEIATKKKSAYRGHPYKSFSKLLYYHHCSDDLNDQSP